MSYIKKLNGLMLVSETSVAAFPLTRFSNLARVPEKRVRVPSSPRVPGVAHHPCPRPKKEETWVTDVIILTIGLNLSSAEICAKSKKRSSPQKHPATRLQCHSLEKMLFFITLLRPFLRYRFFAKFSKLQVGHYCK